MDLLKPYVDFLTTYLQEPRVLAPNGKCSTVLYPRRSGQTQSLFWSNLIWSLYLFTLIHGTRLPNGNVLLYIAEIIQVIGVHGKVVFFGHAENVKTKFLLNLLYVKAWNKSAYKPSSEI